MKEIFLFLILLCFSFINVQAQTEEEETVLHNKRQVNTYYRFFSVFNLDYGLTYYNIKPHTTLFNNNGSLTFNYYGCLENIDKSSNSSFSVLVKTRFSRAENSFGGSDKLSEIKMSSSQFGSGFYFSIGYYSDNLSVLPYNSLPLPLSWCKIKVDTYPDNIPMNEKEYINKMEGKIRFGTLREIGIMFFIKNKYVINLNYENQIIYPRHLVLMDFGSQSLEFFSTLILFLPISFLESSSNSRTGIIITNFILQSVLNYGYSKLRQDKIYWPFNSEPGLSIQQFKLGFGIAIP